MIKKTTKLALRCETLRQLQLAEVHGGSFITTPTKPNASCFQCKAPSGNVTCDNTHCNCVEG
jgi:hypothetical protein